MPDVEWPELLLYCCVAKTEEEVGDVLEAVRLASEQFRSLATSQGDGV